MKLLPASNPTRYFLALGAAAAAGAFGIAAHTARVMNEPREPTPLDDFTFSPFEMQVPHEAVSFRTNDGVTIRGWWFPADSDRVVIGLTGHRGAKHELLGIGGALWRAGNNVLLFDFRGCGESDAAPLSLAYKELPDARAAVEYVQRRLPDARIGMIGYSMGGAVAILEAAENPAIQAVVADSAFASIDGVVAYAYRQHRLPTVIVRLADFVNRWRYGYPFSAVRPVDVIGKIAPRPVLLIHGSDDVVTPVDHVYQIHEAAGEPKDLWVLEGIPHCGAYFVDRSAYVTRITSFFEEAFARVPLPNAETGINGRPAPATSDEVPPNYGSSLLPRWETGQG